MTRKTSTFSRKRTAQRRLSFPRNAWLAAVQRCQSFSAEPVAGEAPSSETADHIMLKARLHLKLLTNMEVDASDVETHDYLAHCIGIAQIRAMDIGDAGGIITQLNHAAKALVKSRDRWERLGKWGLDGPSILALREGIDLYETILRASTPMEMENAQTVRLANIKKLQAS